MSKKMTHENFVQKIKDIHGDNYEIKSNYNGSQNKILINHIACNYEWWTYPYYIYKLNNGCPKCNKKIKYSTEEFKEKVKKITNDKIEVLGEYVNNKTKIKLRHKLCKHEWECTPAQIMNRKSGCPKCSKSNKKTRTIIKNYHREVEDLTGKEFHLIGEYINNYNNVIIKHELCDYEFKINPLKFLSSPRCPICHSPSGGAMLISLFLINNHVNFIQEYVFKDLLSDKNAHLRFDFAIFSNKKELLYLIEYDGQQHFKQIPYYGGDEYFNTVKINDGLKNNYCKNNNINLIRIPYYNKANINQILTKMVI